MTRYVFRPMGPEHVDEAAALELRCFPTADPASLLDAEVVEVMEPPFPAVSAEDPVRDAVELLVGDQQALLVTRDGRAEGLVTRTDLLEALAA